jgi:hypothetical protein
VGENGTGKFYFIQAIFNLLNTNKTESLDDVILVIDEDINRNIVYSNQKDICHDPNHEYKIIEPGISHLLFNSFSLTKFIYYTNIIEYDQFSDIQNDEYTSNISTSKIIEDMLRNKISFAEKINDLRRNLSINDKTERNIEDQKLNSIGGTVWKLALRHIKWFKDYLYDGNFSIKDLKAR